MPADIVQQLQQIGSALGPLATTAAGFLARKVRSLTDAAAEAKTLAEATKVTADTAKTNADAAKLAADSAKTTAEGIKHIADAAKALAEGLTENFAQVRGALRLELSAFKNEIEERIRKGKSDDDIDSLIDTAISRFNRDVIEPIQARFRDLDRSNRGSRPDFDYEEEGTGRFGALRSTLNHEREQRIALQETLNAHMKDEAERWLKLERTMGGIETTIEDWRQNRRQNK